MTAEQKVTRKLRAILSADVKGYSLLMTKDEVFTIQTLKKYRKIMSKLIKQHSGRVVDAPGDNLLAEFSSAVEAVQCSVEIQKELKTKNADLPDDKRLVFRMGVNIGDVIQDGENLYGEGVNIAARIEGLAEPGGVCISRNAYDHIKNKVKLGYEYIGDHSVKNIKDPVRVYKVLMAKKDAGKIIGDEPKSLLKAGTWATVVIAAIVMILIGYQVFKKITSSEFEPAAIENMAFPLPEKPSIAVLPFDNMSGDPKQQHIANGFSESIISSLSKIPDMMVIARNSTFVYQDKAVEVSKIAEKFGVRYVLEGSVQKSGGEIRVTAQLVDAVKGYHLWSERYDRDMKDLFAVMDDITRNIVIALQVKLIEGEQAVIWHDTDNLKAWEYATQGITLMQFYTKEKNAKARALFEKAVKEDPNYTFGWISTAWTHGIDARYGFSESREESFKQCIELTQKAAKLNENMPEIHSTWNFIYMLQRQYDKAISEGKKAVALMPSDATSHMLLSLTLHFAGRFEESIYHIKEAMRLDPYYPTSHLYILGNSYCMARNYEKAITVLEKAMERSKKEGVHRVNNYTRIIQALVEFGQIGKAKQYAAEVIKLDPTFSLANWQKSLFYKNHSDLERHLIALTKAGLPEKPSLPLPDNPSIAVLPFSNMSGDTEQEYFSDGITEQITTSLSNVPYLLVIASNSTFTYKNKSVKVQQIAQDLGVKYILEGSVQKSEDRLRITAKLVDGLSGHHLWAENYDRKLTDIFRIQDEITKEIVAKLQIELSGTELGRLTAIKTDNLRAYEKYLKGHKHLSSRTIGDTLKARKFGEEAIKLDPGYGVAHQLIAITYLDEIFMHRVESRSENLKKAENFIQKAVRLSGEDYMTHRTLSTLYFLKKQFDKAINEAQKAVELNPNSAECQYMYGMILGLNGNHIEAIPVLERAIRLNPISPIKYLNHLARQYFFLNQYYKAIPLWEKALKKNPEYYFAHMSLVAAYQITGENEKAKESANELIRLKPNFTVSFLEKRFIQKGKNNKALFLKALREAGLPE